MKNLKLSPGLITIFVIALIYGLSQNYIRAYSLRVRSSQKIKNEEPVLIEIPVPVNLKKASKMQWLCANPIPGPLNTQNFVSLQLNDNQ
jgi:hypothetical protein